MRHMQRRFLVLFALVAVVPLLGSAALLHGHKPAAEWQPLSGPPAQSSPFTFSLSASMADPSYLSDFIADRSDPSSPNWLQWHTYESLEAHIAPSPSAASAIEQWLGGPPNVAWDAYGPFYRVTATVPSAEALFNTTLTRYQHQPTGLVVVRQHGPSYLPDAVHAVIDAVHGLDTHDVAVLTRRAAIASGSSSTTAAGTRHSFQPLLWNDALTGHGHQPVVQLSRPAAATCSDL